jgi:hypothetical protein
MATAWTGRIVVNCAEIGYRSLIAELLGLAAGFTGVEERKRVQAVLA